MLNQWVGPSNQTCFPMRAMNHSCQTVRPSKPAPSSVLSIWMWRPWLAPISLQDLRSGSRNGEWNPKEHSWQSYHGEWGWKQLEFGVPDFWPNPLRSSTGSQDCSSPTIPGIHSLGDFPLAKHFINSVQVDIIKSRLMLSCKRRDMLWCIET